jgi:predicted ABC-type ATPase
MSSQESGSWSVEQLRSATTSAVYRDLTTGEWTPKRAELHEEIIARLLAGRRGNKKGPKIWIVVGGVGSGKSDLIKTDLGPKHPRVIVIDADRMWVEIPEYEALAAADRRTAGDRTYAELRVLRDQALAEAAARGLSIILEVSGDEPLDEVLALMERDGYKVSINYVHCPAEEARMRMQERLLSTIHTPEDNLWGSPPSFPDKYDYQNVDKESFRSEYEKRKKRLASGSIAGADAHS